MKCENCPTRICLDDDVKGCPYVGTQTTRQFTFTEKFEDCCNDIQRSIDQVEEIIEMRKSLGNTTLPTPAQIGLVSEYFRVCRPFSKPAEYTKQAYFAYIRDVVMKDEEFQRHKSYGSGVDEDWCMEFCQNDVWTEEY